MEGAPAVREPHRIAAPAEAPAVLRDAERRAWSVVAAGVAVAVVAAALARFAGNGLAGLEWVAGAAGAVLAWLSALDATRARRARRQLPDGCARAQLVGWTRVPDGSNFAVMHPGDDAVAYVVRLATTRPALTAEALVTGSGKAGSATALLLDDGALIGVGRVRGSRGGLRVWARRHRPTPRWLGGDARRQEPSR